MLSDGPFDPVAGGGGGGKPPAPRRFSGTRAAPAGPGPACPLSVELASELLNVSDASLESRAYLVEFVLPTLVVGLEKLLVEVERRDVDLADAGNGADAPAGRSRLVAASPLQGVSVGVGGFGPENVPFEPVNFLAQWLYRNNPRFAAFGGSSPYLKQLGLVAAELKNRMFALEESRRAKVKADATAKAAEQERKQQQLLQRQLEKRRMCEDLLATVYRKWCNKLWRAAPGFVTHRELVRGLEDAQASDQTAEESLRSKVTDLCSAVRQADGEKKLDSAGLQELLIPHLEKFSADEVQRLLAGLSAIVDLAGDALKAEFDSIFLTPVLSLDEEYATGDLAVFKRQLRAAAREFAGSDAAQEVPDAAGVAAAVDEFCSPEPGEGPEPGEAASQGPELVEMEFSRFCKRLVGQHGICAMGSLLDFIVRKYGRPRRGAGYVRRPSAAPPLPPPPTAEPEQAAPAADGGAPPEAPVGTAAAAHGERLRTSADAVFDACSAGRGEDVLVSNFNRLLRRHVSDMEHAQPGAPAPAGEDPAAGAARATLIQASKNLLIPADAGDAHTRRIPRAEFVQRLLAELERAGISPEEGAGLLESLANACAAGRAEMPDRAALEAAALQDLKNLARDRPRTTAQFADGAAEIIRRFHQNFHDLDVNVALGLLEEGAVLPAGGESAAAAACSGMALRYEGCDGPLRALMIHEEVVDSPESVEFRHLYPNGVPKEGEEEVAAGEQALELSNARFVGPALQRRASEDTGSDLSAAVHTLLVSVRSKDGALLGVLRTDILARKKRRSADQAQTAQQFDLDAFAADGFAKEDAIFNKNLAEIIASAVEAIDLRERVTQLAQASAKWIRDRGDGVKDVEFFFVEKADRELAPAGEEYRVLLATGIDSAESAGSLAAAAGGSADEMADEGEEGEDAGEEDKDEEKEDEEEEEEGDEAEAKGEGAAESEKAAENADAEKGEGEEGSGGSRDVAGREDAGERPTAPLPSDGTPPEKPKPSTPENRGVQEIKRSDTERSFVFKAIDSGQREPVNIDGRLVTPIFDAEGALVAMLAVRFEPEATQAQDAAGGESAQKDELAVVTSVVATGISEIKKARARRKSRARGPKTGLAADDLDEESQRALLFPRLMLMKVRQNVRLIDSAAIAELKSYKKPPPTVWKVLKAVLYIFGIKPAQVDTWEKTVKFLNMELLRKICDYDPTAVQKKRPFVLIKRAMKTIPHGEVRQKGSSPAHKLYNWLVVSLYMRERAVVVRKRAKAKARTAKAL